MKIFGLCKNYCGGLHLLLYRLVIVLNCLKIPQGDANKSANRFDIYAPKVEECHLHSITCLAGVNIKYNSSHDFFAYFLLATLLKNTFANPYQNGT